MEAEGTPSDYCSRKSILKRFLVFSCAFIALLLVAAAVTISYTATGKDSDLYTFEIGDILGKSSLLIEVELPMSSAITFSFNQQPYTILLSDNVPSTITDYFPLQQLDLPLNSSEVPKFEYRGDFNYLGSNEPIYLLYGSSIKYNLTITSTRKINTTHSACLYLFSNETHYNNFLMSVDSIIYNDSHCFTSAVTPGTTNVSHYFNIVNAGEYYVGILLQSSGVAVQANASVLQVYYNTTGLQQQTNCTGIMSCSIDVCVRFLCSRKATTYFLIKPFYKIYISYFFTSPDLHGVTLGSFIATLVLIGISCCFLCFFCFYFEKPSRTNRSNHASRSRSINNERLHSRRPDSFFSQNFEPDDEEPLLPRIFLSKSKDKEIFQSSNVNSSISSCTDLFDVTADKQQSNDSSTTASDLPSSYNLTETYTMEQTIPQELVTYQQPNPTTEVVKLKSCENDAISTSMKPQIYMEPRKAKRTSEQICNLADEKLITEMKNAFGELQKLSLDRSGLVYHCSQYGVTLIIPEGAVQESATVWFGACLFSDKFQFGDYVPVTPIVWVHIDRKLDKSAELYIPHDIVTSSEDNIQQFTVLTAHDDDCSDVISFQENYRSQFQVLPGLFKILSPHFCSNCVAIQKRKCKSIPRRYLIAQADKKNGMSELLVQFIFLYQQKGCKKVVEEQCAKEGFRISSWEPITITGDGQVSLSFEPSDVPGWKREEIGFSKGYISIEDIDYYQMMGCENAAEVTEDELERLEVLEDVQSYPPCFKIKFTSDAVVEKSAKVMVQFNQVYPPWKNTILLEGINVLPLSPSTSTSSTSLIPHENDMLLGDCLCIIASEGDLKEKWFDFGYKLNITLSQLQEIELTGIDSIRCTRKVIIHWRDQNRSESWEPLAVALAKIGFRDLAHRVKNHFDSPVLEAEHNHHYKGVYCKLCDDYHLKPEDIQQEIPNSKSPPNMVDLINLVAAKIQDNFYKFGTALHLDDSFLKSLYDTYHDPMDRFIAVFNRWKNNDPDTYTWGTVIKVLQSSCSGSRCHKASYH